MCLQMDKFQCIKAAITITTHGIDIVAAVNGAAGHIAGTHMCAFISAGAIERSIAWSLNVIATITVVVVGI